MLTEYICIKTQSSAADLYVNALVCGRAIRPIRYCSLALDCESARVTARRASTVEMRAQPFFILQGKTLIWRARMRKLQIKQGLNRAISACASGVGVRQSPLRQSLSCAGVVRIKTLSDRDPGDAHSSTNTLSRHTLTDPRSLHLLQSLI